MRATTAALAALVVLAALAGAARGDCFNGEQDPGEEGVDCGAACGVDCPDCSSDVPTAVLLDREASELTNGGMLRLSFIRSAFVTSIRFEFREPNSAVSGVSTPCDTLLDSDQAAWEVEYEGGASCNVSHTLSVPWSYALQNCGFSQGEEVGEWFQFQTLVNVTTTEPAGRVGDRDDLVKTVQHSMRLIIQYPISVNVTTAPVTFTNAAVVRESAVTSQTYSFSDEAFLLSLATVVGYPYELFLDAGAGDGVVLVPGPGLETGINATAGAPTGACANNGANCVQEFLVAAQPLDGTCTLNARYRVQASVRCLEAYETRAGTCPLQDDERTATFEFTTSTDAFCARVVEVAELEAVLVPYSTDAYDREATSVVMFQPAYAEVAVTAVEGNLELRATELRYFAVRAGGSSAVLWNLGSATPAGAASSVEVVPNVGGDVARHRVSFLMNTVSFPQTAGLAEFVATLAVDYADVGTAAAPGGAGRRRGAPRLLRLTGRLPGAAADEPDVDVSDAATAAAEVEVLDPGAASTSSGSDAILGLEATTWVAMGVVAGMVLVVALSVHLVRRVRHSRRFDRKPAAEMSARNGGLSRAASRARLDTAGSGGSAAAAAATAAGSSPPSSSGAGEGRESVAGDDSGGDGDEEAPYRGRPSRDHLDYASGGRGLTAAVVPVGAGPAETWEEPPAETWEDPAAETWEEPPAETWQASPWDPAATAAEGTRGDPMYFDEDDDSAGMATEEEGSPIMAKHRAAPPQERAVPALKLSPLARSSSSGVAAAGGAAARPASSRLQERRKKLAGLERFDPNSSVDLEVLGSTPRVPNLGAYAHVMTPRTGTPSSSKVQARPTSGRKSPRRSRIPQRPVSARIPAPRPERDEEEEAGNASDDGGAGRGSERSASRRRAQRKSAKKGSGMRRSKSGAVTAREFMQPASAPGGGERARSRGPPRKRGGGGKTPRGGRRQGHSSESPSPSDPAGARESPGSRDGRKRKPRAGGRAGAGRHRSSSAVAGDDRR